MSIRSASVVTIMVLLSGMAFSAEKAEQVKVRALGSTWADAAKMPDLFSGMWMTFSGMVEADAKLNVPYTAKAQKYVDRLQVQAGHSLCPGRLRVAWVCRSPCARGRSSSPMPPG